MLVRILEKAGERIAQRNYVYVVRARVPESGEASRNDRKGKDDADVDDERCDEKPRFVGGRQASTEYSRTWRETMDEGKSDLTFVI